MKISRVYESKHNLLPHYVDYTSPQWQGMLQVLLAKSQCLKACFDLLVCRKHHLPPVLHPALCWHPGGRSMEGREYTWTPTRYWSDWGQTEDHTRELKLFGLTVRHCRLPDVVARQQFRVLQLCREWCCRETKRLCILPPCSSTTTRWISDRFLQHLRNEMSQLWSKYLTIKFEKKDRLSEFGRGGTTISIIFIQ